MEEVRYMISEAAKRVGVESHVLRYWQKNLALPISRNEMDQRYYKESDIELLKKIKHLMEQGFRMKAINMVLSNLNTTKSPNDIGIQQIDGQEDKVIEMFQEDKLIEKEEETSLVAEEETSLVGEEEAHEVTGEENTKMGQFQAILSHIISSALKENNGALSEEISMNVTSGVTREMSYLIKIQEEKEEERFKKFDATLREYQKSRTMTAASFDKNKKKSKFFKKNKVNI